MKLRVRTSFLRTSYAKSYQLGPLQYKSLFGLKFDLRMKEIKVETQINQLGVVGMLLS